MATLPAKSNAILSTVKCSFKHARPGWGCGPGFSTYCGLVGPFFFAIHNITEKVFKFVDRAPYVLHLKNLIARPCLVLNLISLIRKLKKKKSAYPPIFLYMSPASKNHFTPKEKKTARSRLKLKIIVKIVTPREKEKRK